MVRTPAPLDRPVVVVGGYGDPGFAGSALREAITRRVAEDDRDRVLAISFTKEASFDECRTNLIDAVRAAFGGDETGATVEVDVVANSMGGLIAAHAADDLAGEGVLRIHRMFALSTPFLGSGMAELAPVNELVRDMQPGSAFLEGVQASMERAPYELIPYVRLGDVWVGTANTAPAGETPYWVPNRAFQPAHLTAYSDPRIQADVLRRLRGEPAYTTEPRTPIPGTDDAADPADE